MFDSFEGLSEPAAIDGTHWAAGDLSVGVAEVEANLDDCTGFTIHQGWIPTTFGAVEELRFCFVHIDVDLHQPTLDSLSFFYSRLVDGGMILCDDYGFTTCPGATSAVDDFLADKPEQMIALPDGGGLMIKGRTTERSWDLIS